MTCGEQCVMTPGTSMMPPWSANSWDMHTLEVSASAVSYKLDLFFICCFKYGTGGTPYHNAFFGAGTGPIYLDDVACSLSDSQLLECSSRPILAHNCDHRADAGVGCEGKFLF